MFKRITHFLKFNLLILLIHLMNNSVTFHGKNRDMADLKTMINGNC